MLFGRLGQSLSKTKQFKGVFFSQNFTQKCLFVIFICLLLAVLLLLRAVNSSVPPLRWAVAWLRTGLVDIVVRIC